MSRGEQDMAESRAQMLVDFADLAERLRRSTVEVRGRARGGGSGVIWRGDGLIVTNAHVVPGRRANVRLADGRDFDATVMGRDEARDLAALAIPATDLPAVAVGDSGALRVGELALAVGNPFGQVGALAAGIIHAAGERWVQADVRLAPGNSGGPLANARGELVGINSMIARGLALAVPSREVERFLARGARAARPRLGVSFRPVAASSADSKAPGLLLLGIEPGSAAERSDLMIGDILVGVGGRRFRSPEDLAVALDGAGAGGWLRLEVIRGGRRMVAVVSFDAAAGVAEAA